MGLGGDDWGRGETSTRKCGGWLAWERLSPSLLSVPTVDLGPSRAPCGRSLVRRGNDHASALPSRPKHDLTPAKRRSWLQAFGLRLLRPFKGRLGGDGVVLAPDPSCQVDSPGRAAALSRSPPKPVIASPIPCTLSLRARRARQSALIVPSLFQEPCLSGPCEYQSIGPDGSVRSDRGAGRGTPRPGERLPGRLAHGLGDMVRKVPTSPPAPLPVWGIVLSCWP
jgi:hypothetical protein